jgi:hypothetical protein
MMSMKYDGTSDITLFLRGFDGLRTRILGLDPDYDDFVIEATLSTCLEDAKPSPSVGVDGERYIGPASWWAKQPIDDVDTYDKLKRKLESKFKAKVENMSKIFSRLAQLERGDKTVKEFAYEFDCVRGTAEVHDYTLIDIFTKQMPQTVVKRLLISCPDFRERTYEEVKNLCVKLDHAVRNPDPLEIGLKKLSKLRIGEDRQHHVARLERQLAERQEQLNYLLKGAKRWTNSADALKQEASEHREKSSFRPRSGIVCWNCWKPGHSASDCRDTKRSNKEREALRQQLGVPATKLWEEQLQKHSSTFRAAPGRILTRKTDPREFQKYFGSNFPSEAENLEPRRLTEEGDRRGGRIGERTPRILESDSESESEEQRPAAHLLCIKPERQLFSSAVRPPPVQQDAEATLQEMVPRRPEDLVEKEHHPRRNPVPSLERSAPNTADERQAIDSRADEDTNLTENAISRVLVRILTMRDFEDRRILTMRTIYTEQSRKLLVQHQDTPCAEHYTPERMPRRIYRGFKLFWRREPFEISYVDYSGFLERPADKKYCHYNYLDGQLYKHKWAIRKGFTQWLEEELGLDVTLQQLEFSPHYPIVAMFDASPWSISAVFGQLSTKLPDSESPQSIAREFKPIVFLSKVLTDTQSRWSQPEREAYAIYHFVTENRHLLLGSKVYFFSDCRPITDAFRSSKLSKNLKAGGRRARTYTGEAELPGVMGSHFYHLKYGERLEHGETIDAVDIEKMTEVNGKYVPSEYKITRLGPGPEPPPASDAWSLGFGDVKLTFLMVYIRRTFTFVFRTQGAHSHGQQHSLISYYVDKPDPDPEPPPGCLHSLPDGEDQAVVAGGIVVELR